MTDEIVIRLGLFGTDAIKLPVNEELEKAINTYVYEAMQKALTDKEAILATMTRMVSTNREHFKKMFTPILKEIIEELEIRFTSD